jgi:hypothetical protein
MSGRGAASFVEGLQGGMTHRKDAKRAKKLDRMLDVRGQKDEMDLWAQQDDAKKAGAEEGWDMDFSSFETDQDPYDMNIKGFFGKLGNAVGIKNDWGKKEEAAPVKTRMPGWSGPEENGKGGANTFAMAEEPTLPGGEYFGPQSADGGAVRHMLKKYADGGAANLTPQELARRNRLRTANAQPNQGPQPRPAPRAINDTTAPKAKPAPKGAVSPDATPKSKPSGLRAGSRLNPNITARGVGAAGKAVAKKLPVIGAAVSAADAVMDQTQEGYGERMDERFGNWGWESEDKGEASIGGALEYGAKRALGFASDLGDAALGGLPSMLYRDKRDGYGIGPEEASYLGAAPSDTASAIEASDIAAEDPAKNASQPAPPQTQQPQAQQEPVEAAGGPDGDIDWSKQRVIDPGQMPTHSTQDWVAYRASSVTNMIMRGASPDEAHQRVTAMQQRGFMNHGQQALMLLAAGDAPRATMALKAAYQYFPNGVDVKFGITEGKDGQPALIAMGQLEGSEDGESTGKPMLLTQERLAAMLNNMSDPAAFTNWTKDWRDEQFKERKYHEVDKPGAEATAQAITTNAQANLNRSEASMYTAQHGGGQKPMTNSEFISIQKMMIEKATESGLWEDTTPAQQELLGAVMANYSAITGSANAAAIIQKVMEAHRSGRLPVLMDELGMTSQEAVE